MIILLPALSVPLCPSCGDLTYSLTPNTLYEVNLDSYRHTCIQKIFCSKCFYRQKDTPTVDVRPMGGFSFRIIPFRCLEISSLAYIQVGEETKVCLWDQPNLVS